MNLPTSPGLTVLATGNLDHGGMTVTKDPGTGVLSTHFAWNDDSAAINVQYRRFTAGVPVSTTVSGISNWRAGISRGVGDRVYAWGFDPWGNELFNICPVWPLPAGPCVSVPYGAVPPTAPDILFGTGSATQGVGMGLTPSDCKNGILFFPCFYTAQPAIVFSKTIVDKVYVVFQGQDPSSMALQPSIYYVTNTPMSGFGTWAAPIRVNARTPGSTLSYIDPAVTVDADETVTVVYSEIESNQTYPTGVSRLAMMSTPASVFTVTSLTRYWYPEHLAIHCLKNKYFLGEYLEGDSIGGRSFMTMHQDPDYSTTQLAGFWASRWSAV